LFQEAFASDELELGHTMAEAVREDAMAVLRRDPACETLLEVVMFMKGFLSLVIHRAARRAWKPDTTGGSTALQAGDIDRKEEQPTDDGGSTVKGTRFVALLLQSHASSAFGVDIHPAAQIGAGVMIDHATGVVVGETATVGDGTTILHGVTLGGTGKESGDRHPKVGKDVLIGAGTKILGNIFVGDRAKIGAGSVVLRPIPTGATAVGAPAKIIGFTPKGERPGSSVDISLAGVEPLAGNKQVVGVDKKDDATKESLGLPVDDGVSANTIQKVTETEVEGDTEESTNDGDAASSSSADNEKDNSNGEEDEEEDDELTDFGTPARCHWIKASSHNDDICPFRNSFRKITSSVCSNKDWISHPKLRTLLLQQGCTDGETVEVFFELLHHVPASSQARQCGCIPLDIFSKYFAQIACEKTHLDLQTCQALAHGDLRTLSMSKKASKRFRPMFAKLGRQMTEGAMKTIPSDKSVTISLPPVSARRNSCSKSEKNEMEEFLDTSAFAEGINI
jgi:serine O-acetyltransferase